MLNLIAAALSILFSSGSTISSIVIRHALPPTALEMGSAMNTPSAPKWKTPGRRSVSGTTMTTLRNREKKIACFFFPSALKVVCPVYWSDWKIKAKKYR